MSQREFVQAAAGPAAASGLWLTLGMAALPILLGCLGLLSRVLDLPQLRGMGVAELEMKPNTAIGFILGGCSVLLLISPHKKLRSLGQAIACLLLLLGLLSL